MGVFATPLKNFGLLLPLKGTANAEDVKVARARIVKDFIIESFSLNEDARLIQTIGPNHKKCGKFYTVQHPEYEVITLEKMNVRTIYQVFQDAFTGYFVEFDKRPEVHIERWLTSGVDFALSYGVKKDGALVAFLLHAPRGPMVMNLATGVKREFQGQGLTGLMYERILKDLPAKGFSKAQLEVITENHRAIHAYEKTGFVKGRKLLSWKGTMTSLPPGVGEHRILPLALSEEHKELTPYPYAFEQDQSVIMKKRSTLELHELRTDGKLVAYSVWNPWSMYLVQLGGKDRESLRGLLHFMNLAGKHLGMINVDERNELVNGVLKETGLLNFLSQYEMERVL